MHRPTSLAASSSMTAPISRGRAAEILEFPVCDQYTAQGDLFSQSIRERAELPVPLEGSIGNMAVIEAIFRSAKSGNWERPLAV